MNDTIKEVDHLKIGEDFERVTDYRTFILQYNHIQHHVVNFLIIKARWYIILNEKDNEQQSVDLILFIRMHSQSDDIRVRNFVAHAMLLQLKQYDYALSLSKYLEICNNFIEYTSLLQNINEHIYKGLILAYWFKAELISTKDWRKAEYFYNKIIDFCQKISEGAYTLYSVKSEIAKVFLHLHHGHDEYIEKSFYVIMQEYVDHKEAEIISLLDELINCYIHYLMSQDTWFHQAELGQVFVEFLSNHLGMQKIMLQSENRENSVPRLIWVSYAYWGNQYHVLCEQYLLRYYKFFNHWEEVLRSFKEYLQFNTAKDRKLFLEYAKELHKRHVNLEKYRKMFRADKARN